MKEAAVGGLDVRISIVSLRCWWGTERKTWRLWGVPVSRWRTDYSAICGLRVARSMVGFNAK